ncbi:tRNA lysidine(34) synthetase TilS [Blattabacterium sp. (Blaberus giganteus)]|uniref:tRNA lysidine(34) synthetase TilS n=1 Tax=Blattabacterium sp. (Blaberus giganteus) TaxID=1186051 RepID=UPI00025F6ED0|nr:tRNA lysidine(34) synthetase TilS [Blattabacterium sp. (Blaberus giganteus)]AFJ90657.1 PP-loop family protein [Blattabacterium sp. (Blaberus giganteus)]
MKKISCDHFFLDEIKKYFSFDSLNKKKVCVAVSGGLDSMVLINLFLNIPEIESEVAHCNFSLRNKESNEDEIFIRNFCFKRSLVCHVKKFDTLNFSKKHKLSIQMAARKLRYNWFEKLLKKNSYEYMVLGHHFDDSIETFFINIFRGTGIKGLLGIPKKNEKFIRPLSDFTKKEILHYAKIKNIKWRSDSSNQEVKYLRNKIRSVLSTFYSLSFSFHNGLKKTINYLHYENFLIEKKIEKVRKEITMEKKNSPFFWRIECKKIKQLKPLSFYLFKLFSPYGFNDIKSMKQLIDAQSGKQLISKTYRIIKSRNDWILVSHKFLSENKNKTYIIPNIKIFKKMLLPVDMKIFFDPKKENRKNMFFIDFEKIQFPLLLRTWKKGDFFFPFKMKGKKKLSKYYKEKKFSLLEKEHTWLLINGNGSIILIIGNRLDDRFKVTENTKKILGIKI